MKAYEVEQRELAEQSTAVVRSVVHVDDMGTFVGRAIGTVARTLEEQGFSPAGPPFARYRRLGGGEFDVESGFPVASRIEPTPEVLVSALPGGQAAVLVHVGPYEEMEAAYDALSDWVAQKGEEPAGDAWEVYLSDPSLEPDAHKWRTEIVMPLAPR